MGLRPATHIMPTFVCLAITVEKDNDYAMSLYQKVAKNSGHVTTHLQPGFAMATPRHATGQLGASNIQVNSHSLAALPGFTAARNSFISRDL